MADEVFDVAVIGLGALGAATLRALAAAGVRVLGIDRFDPPHAHGSSHGESRITRLAIGEGDAYVPLVQRSHAIWRDLEQQTGRDIYTACGGLILAPEGRVPDHHGKPDFVRRTIGCADRFGIRHEVWDAPAIHARFPQFALQGNEVAYWEPDAGFVRPEQAIAAQLEVAQRHGALVRRQQTVHALDPRPGGEEVRIDTDQGSHLARQVVVAAGAWLPEFLGTDAQRLLLGDTPLRVYRQVMHWFDASPAGDAFAPERFPIFIWMFGDGEEDYMYGFPSADPERPTLKVASERYGEAIQPGTLRREVDPEESLALFRAGVAGRFPAIGGRVLDARACMYTVTPDRDFLVDELPGAPGVWVASACSGHGFKHSAGLGEALANRLLGRPGGELIDPFARRPGRAQDRGAGRRAG